MYVYRNYLQPVELCEKELPPSPGVAAEFGPRFTESTLLHRGRLRSSFFNSTLLAWTEVGVDVASLPVKELVAIFGGNVPSVQRWVHPQLAE